MNDAIPSGIAQDDPRYMTVWLPRPSRAGATLAIVAGGTLFLSAIVLWLATRQPIGLGMFIGLLLGASTLALAGAVAVVGFGYFSLRYRMEPDALVVRWLDREERIPYGDIDGILGGHRLGPIRIRGLDMPGYRVGLGRSRALGTVRMYSTTKAPDDLVLVLTAHVSYALAPADPTGFRQQLIEAAKRSGESTTSDFRSLRPGMQAVPRDPVMLGAGAISVIFLCVMIAWIMLRYAELPDLMPLHFDAAANPDYVSSKAEVFRFPGVGAAILLINVLLGVFIYSRERVGARLLWGATCIIELVILVAAVRVVSA